MNAISDYLAISRAAHADFQRAQGSINAKGVVQTLPDDSAAARHIQWALEARESAEAIDPAHNHIAWADDIAANRGVSSAEMLAFYRDYLAPDQPL